MNQIHKNNVKEGRENEEMVLNYLNRKEERWISRPEYSVIDFSHTSKNKQAELKSRKFKSSAFPDWQIGANKIQEMVDNPNTEYIVYFLFYDGLFYWKFHWTKLMTDCEYRMGGTIKRGRDETKKNVFIRKECLTKLTDKIKYPEDFDKCML